ncbi:hypothetical protein [Aerosakkonema funiforme]|uniref:PEP-CTERM sorting domain-containing protein n=2 Tax=Oscillatoriophycideae TaxID=1301283 RepID=A0A926VI69_9CYAN|nr:hypothetical protein [Aerosakkonema funiforme]MBD2183162.1 hypothetical protein [Aerosakkonema funiforme FACHB-1375]
MLPLQKFFLAATTLIALETATISPALALTFNFHFIDPVPPGPLSGIKGGSLTVADSIDNVNLGYQGGSGSPSGINVGGITGMSSQFAVERTIGWRFFANDTWNFGSWSTGVYWELKISCPLNLTSCSGSSGSFYAKSYSSVSPLYSGSIAIDNFSLPKPPISSVPEPGGTIPLLLLGAAFLTKKLTGKIIAMT